MSPEKLETPRLIPGMAEEAWFNRVEVFGGFDGRPYDQGTERLILRAVRAQ